MEKLNIVEPSQHMQRTAQSLIQDLKDLPHINSYTTLQLLGKNIDKSERKHDLVIASYVLGEIPSLQDRITTVRQLWDLTGDVLVLVEPGSPHGAGIISQMRSHILWKEKRKTRKMEKASGETCKDLVDMSSGAHIVAPCPHDGACPLDNTGKYCHFVQRLERTTSQRAYKQIKGKTLRGFEDEKFCYVVFRRGQRPSKPWPLDGMEFETLEEQHANRNLQDLEIDPEDNDPPEDEDDEDAKYKLDKMSYNSDMSDSESETDEIKEDENEDPRADLGSGWGRIVYSPIRRGKRILLDVCRATDHSGSDGSFERIVVTKIDNPKLHLQARRSLWGDLWPF
jgi:ribosomal protein RSM22 (predicted rRNA methylase)